MSFLMGREREAGVSDDIYTREDQAPVSAAPSLWETYVITIERSLGRPVKQREVDPLYELFLGGFKPEEAAQLLALGPAWWRWIWPADGGAKIKTAVGWVSWLLIVATLVCLEFKLRGR